MEARQVWRVDLVKKQLVWDVGLMKDLLVAQRAWDVDSTLMVRSVVLHLGLTKDLETEVQRILGGDLSVLEEGPLL